MIANAELKQVRNNGSALTQSFKSERARERWRRFLAYLPILPFVIAILAYELLPLIQLGIGSFIGKESKTFGFENYIKVLTTPLYQQSILNSLQISIVSTMVGIVVAFMASDFYMEATGRQQRRFQLLINMTSNFAGIPLSFAFMILMGNTGILTLLAQRIGIPFFADFDLYSANGLMMVYIYFQIPFATLLMIPVFRGVRPEWKQAAVILKANTFQYTVKILLPNLLPGILGTFSVLFSNALAAYATAYAIVTNNYALLALQITSKFKGDAKIDKATGGALAMVMIILMVLCSVMNNYLSKKNSKGRDVI